MSLLDWFGNKTPETDGSKLQARVHLPAARQFDHHPLVEKLDPELRHFADSFYLKFQEILPSEYIFSPDRQAPEHCNCLSDPNPHHPFTSISLEFRHIRGTQSYKFGTGRVELRQNHFFAKTVTWQTPKMFLHQRSVYDLIKCYYKDSKIMTSRSRSANGFALKNKRHIITLEVFGEHPQHGFLACDLTLNAKNKPLAQERMEHFMEFYGCVYNLLENQDLTYKVVPRDPDEPEVEYVEDYSPEPEENHQPGSEQV